MRKISLTILVILSICIGCITTPTNASMADAVSASTNELLDSTVTSAYNGKQYKTILIWVGIKSELLRSRYEQMFEKSFKGYSTKIICSTDIGYTNDSYDQLRLHVKKFGIDGVLIISSEMEYPDYIFLLTLHDANTSEKIWKATTKVNSHEVSSSDDALSIVAGKTPETLEHDSLIKRIVPK